MLGCLAQAAARKKECTRSATRNILDRTGTDERSPPPLPIADKRKNRPPWLDEDDSLDVAPSNGCVTKKRERRGTPTNTAIGSMTPLSAPNLQQQRRHQPEPESWASSTSVDERHRRWRPRRHQNAPHSQLQRLRARPPLRSQIQQQWGWQPVTRTTRTTRMTRTSVK